MDMENLHVAIIMDGNGRWAEERGWPRSRGHRAGAAAVRSVVEASPRLGITTLTLYAFSSDNWRRPAPEVATLMALFRNFLDSEAGACRREGVRLSVIGRRDRLSAALVTTIEQAEATTAGGQVLNLRLAVDYSSRDAIAAAAALHQGAVASREGFRTLLARSQHGDPCTPDVDLLIRTGREQRLSDFLLWECAYAELLFSSVLWPDFTGDDLGQAVETFSHRNRRFGSVPQACVAEPVRKTASR
ncbi:di-trans,poly-cis-decaprenylcistransferase [Frateuria sp. MAH-13]|uniref:Ditrans,polycis-undecaprenyl-diphosphate synthase ((2E,6E)-farnesyl-diphosphate specific) n=1 Tax=Frateuria flava TaxID=2821489 RepID=A0ABS4DQ74_9GAMM|nr:di-trans,poly-cis-decaprenylcistransferase [Frateuria flava]MBP1475212.1 di-trans,poly-cis-decaprenylcistransferase [Frateuria flava]